MAKGRRRGAVVEQVEQLGQNSAEPLVGSLNIPQAPSFYPSEEEFQDPLKYIYKIRPIAEPYGVCKIIPPKDWKPPFALDLDKFRFPTKTQAIHQLQVRAAACDRDTFELEYTRFLEGHCGKKLSKKVRVVFEGSDLDLCKLFNAVKRYGGYDKVVKEKKWGVIFRFVRSKGKITECAKHVLSQLYSEHLYDYEMYNSQLNCENTKEKCKRGVRGVEDDDGSRDLDTSSPKKRRKNNNGERVKKEKLDKEEDFDQICEQCRSGLHGEVMLLCDRCNKGWHIYCLSPPLKKIPPGNWYCLECINSDKDSFGFVPGKNFSLETFRRLADKAKRKWFGSASPSRLQIEQRFWEIVDGSMGEVEVMYGNDLDTSVYGSGFPRSNDSRPTSVEVEEWEKYSSSPWNLNNLPKLQGSMLQAVHNNIAGVMVPWLYIGMLFSSFCWHFEDHCFYSINYLHWGEAKCWYSVPGCEAQAFEQVMRKSLPDLFDAQPDLLFQLVTMLNPSVLQENGVPVYTVLQEPGNFVITFPRSYHGGFNLGLNCAEAVNFAPADWFPHGGFGAELYRLYHKAAVLSHEELLCVVAKRRECNEEVSPYLKKELLRIFNKEKTWRERLWRFGIVRSSRMSARKNPEYVGSEEDPTCIICQQHVYLSAVACSCRPSSFVCLEHWENLCECRPIKHRLLYRHTLAELNDLMLAMDKHNSEATQSRGCRRQFLSSDDSNALTKKVKSGRVTYTQLAEEWLLNSLKIVQNPFSSAAYINAVKEAEQFLWAGTEMDPVRDMTKNLVDAKKWALDVRNCLGKVETWLHHRNNDTEKVALRDVEKLLSYSHLPCNEPGHLKLKVYAKDASVLLSDITTTLSECSHTSIDELEKLYCKATELPIYIEECGRLAKEISLAKGWVDSVRQCFSPRSPTKVEIDLLNKLKLQMLELHVQLPEMKLLLELLEQVESWEARCAKMLKGPISLKELEILLKDADSFPVNIPVLKLLREHHCDAVSWISRYDKVLGSIQEREDQESIAQELSCILKDGQMLRVQVDELPSVELELKRASCRVTALKARCTLMPLDHLQQLMSEANLLQIGNEKLFIDISGVLAAAISWEERARRVLRTVAGMYELEDLIRSSEKLFLILPSLHEVKDVLTSARSWLRRSQLFLGRKSSSSLLNVGILKEVIAQSELLKVSLEEPEVLRGILKNCESWENEAHDLLASAESLFDLHDLDNSVSKGLGDRIAELLDRFDKSTKAGLSLGFDFSEISKVQNVSLKLRWCLKVITFCPRSPSLEEVDRLTEDVVCISDGCPRSSLESLLHDGLRWLQKALKVFPNSCMQKRCKVSEVEAILEEAQSIKITFPVVVAQLLNAIVEHKSWQEKVHVFFNSRSGEQSWTALLQLKDLGDSVAFESLEFDMITSERGKVEKWILCCKEVVDLLVVEVKPLGSSLLTIKRNLQRALQVYEDSEIHKVRGKLLFMCCSSGPNDHDMLACSMCNDRYHTPCLRSRHANTNSGNKYICPYCLFMESGAVSRNGRINMILKEKRPELKMLMELLSAAKDFSIRVEETEMLQQVVERALDCKAFLTDTLDCVLAYVDGDLSFISKQLRTCLKVVAVAGVYNQETICSLELALTRYSWKVKVKKLLLNLQKPLIHQVQRLLKDGSAIGMPSNDYFIKKLVEVKFMGLQWCEEAKKVASDSGESGLDEVFKLIAEGENLPVHFEKELKSLRARSVLYCVCRKPYDNRAMIACDSCDEWYHFDCINLRGPPPKTYHCPACKPSTEDVNYVPPRISHEERSTDFDDVGPQTPSPRSNKSKRQCLQRSKLRQQVLVVTDLSNILRNTSGIDQLWWRNKKPLKRTCRKRVVLDSLSPFLHLPFMSSFSPTVNQVASNLPIFRVLI